MTLLAIWREREHHHRTLCIFGFTAIHTADCDLRFLLLSSSFRDSLYLLSRTTTSPVVISSLLLRFQPALPSTQWESYPDAWTRTAATVAVFSLPLQLLLSLPSLFFVFTGALRSRLWRGQWSPKRSRSAVLRRSHLSLFMKDAI